MLLGYLTPCEARYVEKLGANFASTGLAKSEIREDAQRWNTHEGLALSR
jgi:hypothetical protein